MKNGTMLTIAVSLLVMGLCIGQAVAVPMGKAFTYQGRLMDGESWANGLYEFEFKLFDQVSDGTQVDGTYSLRSVEVADGYFTVQLDFGSDAFDGDARWLEIGVRPVDTADPFTTLSPRQEVTPSPYALQTRGIFVDNLLNVGIGTTSPLSKLSSGGDGFANTGVYGNGSDYGVYGNSSTYGVFGRGGYSGVHGRDDDSGSFGRLGHDIYGVYGSGTVYGGYFLGDGYFSGNVGVGTTTPHTDLEILGTTGLRVTTGDHSNVFGEFKHAYSGGLIINANAGGGWADMSLQTDTVTRMFIEQAGNVGIGTTAPTQKLHVAGTIRSSSGGFMFPDNSVQTTAAGGTQYWEGLGDSIRNTNAANVGIGVAIPTSKLTVGGNIFVSTADGRIITPILEIIGGSDLSEQFDVGSTENGIEPLPGMVVCIDPENPGELVVSGEGYDRKVAGIISGAGGIKPGMLMGQKGTLANGANPVALTGRVYCLADATNGSIRPGDLLTTSEMPGHAMKVTDHAKAQGAILGKAMTSLDNGQGQVLVLVTLQ